MSPYIIADVGSNHRESLSLAFTQIKEAKEAGANAVKFQMYTHRELYGFKGKVDYEVPRDWIPKLHKKSTEVGIDFMCSAFSLDGYKYIDRYVPIHKVASCESEHEPIINYLTTLGKKVIISDGIGRVKFLDRAGVVPMVCSSSYPANPTDYNLCAYNDMVWGLSEHSCDPNLSILALAKGAKYFEYHFDCEKKSTLDHLICTHFKKTPDSPVSNTPNEIAWYVKYLNTYHRWLRHNKSGIPESILDTHRRRLLCSEPISKGAELKYGVNFGIFRSKVAQDYTSPIDWKDYDGQIATQDYQQGESL